MCTPKTILFFSTILVLALTKTNAQEKAIGLLKYSQITALIDTTKRYLIPVSMYFNQYESVTKQGLFQKMDKSDSSRILNISKSENTRYSVYVNLLKKERRSRERADTELVILQDTLEAINWKIFSETRKIGNMTCQMAQATVRGRTYIAWFTPDIPLSFGPWKLQGLPGLILEAKTLDNTVEFRFEALLMPLPEKETVRIEPIEPFGKMKTVSERGFLALKRQSEINFQKMLESQPGYDKNQPGKVTSTWIELYPENK